MTIALKMINVSAAGHIFELPLQSRLLRFLNWEAYDQRVHQSPKFDIANLSLSVELSKTLYCSGSANSRLAFISIIDGEIRPISGEIRKECPVFTSSLVKSYLLENRMKTVGHVAVRFLDEVAGYPFGSLRNIEDVLASADLLSLSYAKVKTLSISEVQLLAMALLIHSAGACIVVQLDEFDSLGNIGKFMRHEMIIKCSSSAKIFLGEGSLPRWLTADEEIILL